MTFSGKFENVMDTSGAPSSRKMKTHRLVGSIESGKDVISRSTRCGSARARRRYVKTVSVLLVLCVAAIVIASAVALTEASQATISTKADLPPMPHAVFGYTYDLDGTTVVGGCHVTITDLSTGDVIITTSNSVPDEFGEGLGLYSVDLSNFATAWAYGEILNVTAWNPGGVYAGWTEAPITENEYGYDRIDVTMDKDATLIPEFPMVIVPVAGMIALFVVVGLRRRGEEQ